MTPIKAADRANREGKGLDVFCPPPSEWEYDDRGRSTWIPLRNSGTWHRLIDRGRVVVELPSLDEPRDRHHGYGRPRLADTRPDLGEIVWRYDMLGDSHRKIATDLHHAGRDARTTIRYQVRVGRQHLAAAGVVPWAAYPNGTLPPHWWTDEALERLVLRWAGETLRASTRVAARIGATRRATRWLQRYAPRPTWAALLHDDR